MNRVYCEREAEIIEALRGGVLDAELEKHAAGCATCADTLAVSQFLQADHRATQVDSRAAQADDWPAPGLPDPDLLWWKAQLASKQMAVERATRSIAVVRKGSYLGAAVAALWLAFAPGHVGSVLSALAKPELWPTGAWSQTARAFTQTSLFLGVAALVFTLLGCLYLVRPEE